MPDPCNVQLTLTLDQESLRSYRDCMEWIHTAYGRRIMRHLFAITAWYAKRHATTGRKVSMRLLWELTRDRLPELRRRWRDMDPPPIRTHGFALNNNYHSHVARFILDRRPDWAGMFEQRELGAALNRARVFVVNVDKQNHHTPAPHQQEKVHP